MTETFEQYSARLLSLSAGTDAMSILQSTPARIGELISDRTPADLQWTPEPGRWSVAQIVSHLADSEIVLAYRLRMTLSQPGTAIQPYDQNRWTAALHRHTSGARDSLALISAVRQSTVAILRGLDDEELDRYGVHAERGKESIRHLIKLHAGHDLNHLAQIEKLLAERQGSRPPA